MLSGAIMVRAQDVIRAKKGVLDWGKWQAGGMTQAAFPLSKRRRRSLQFGSAYRWRLIRFEACSTTFRLLIAYCLEKEQYRAILALDKERDMAVILAYEYHGTHPGWHVSAACGNICGIPDGVLIGPWQTRKPRARGYQRSTRVEFGITTDQQAFAKAEKFFRLNNAEGALL